MVKCRIGINFGRGKYMKKIEREYIKYSSMSQEELEDKAAVNEAVSLEVYRKHQEDRIIKPIIEQLDILNKQISNIEKSVEYIKDIDKKIEKLKELSEIVKKRDTLFHEKAKRMQKIEEEVTDRQRQGKLMKGYLQNKDKIDRVKQYRDRLLNKKQKSNKEKKENTEKLNKLNKRREEIEKILEKSEELDNNEYNNLLIEKENIKREKEAIEKRQKEIEKALISTSQAISKCNLVWNNLFMGNSWDEINIKAVEMSKRWKGIKVNTSNKTTVETEKENTNKAEDNTKVVSENGQLDNQIKEDNKSQEMVVAKTSIFSKIFNLLKAKMSKRRKIEYKNLNEGISEEQEKSKPFQEKTEQKEVVQEEPVQGERDIFVEELRRYIEENKKTSKDNELQIGGTRRQERIKKAKEAEEDYHKKKQEQQKLSGESKEKTNQNGKEPGDR